MPAIITNAMRIFAANQFISGIADSSQKFYVFIGQTLPWVNDSSPPAPINCGKDQLSAFRNMMSLKLISSPDVTLVVPRYNWTTGTVYTQYTDSVDLFDPNNGLPPFYVLTSDLNVYKCLGNNGGAASTVQPSGTATAPFTASDAYQWKYMFTVSAIDVLNFVTDEWIPVKTLINNDGSNQWLVQQSAVPGSVDRIDIVSSGSQYTQLPSIAINGDGLGAQGTPAISGGNLVAITVTNAGDDYTYANVVISGGGVGANGASAVAVLSPVKGHGADPITELGAFFVMINAKLIFDESGDFTVENDFRQLGIIRNPVLAGTTTVASALDYTQALVLSFGIFSGTAFIPDEAVIGTTSGTTGVVMDWDGTANVLRLLEVVGTFIPGETVVGLNATGVLQTIVGTLVTATSTTVVLPGSASSADGFYNGQMIRITGGTGVGQTTQIALYTGLTRTASVVTAFNPVPDSTSVFVIADIESSELEFFKGDIVYLENRRPITRAGDQTETIKLVIQY